MAAAGCPGRATPISRSRPVARRPEPTARTSTASPGRKPGASPSGRCSSISRASLPARTSTGWPAATKSPGSARTSLTCASKGARSTASASCSRASSTCACACARDSRAALRSASARSSRSAEASPRACSSRARWYSASRFTSRSSSSRTRASCPRHSRSERGVLEGGEPLAGRHASAARHVALGEVAGLQERGLRAPCGAHGARQAEFALCIGDAHLGDPDGRASLARRSVAGAGGRFAAGQPEGCQSEQQGPSQRSVPICRQRDGRTRVHGIHSQRRGRSPSMKIFRKSSRYSSSPPMPGHCSR
jgi:hypothetical protein